VFYKDKKAKQATHPKTKYDNENIKVIAKKIKAAHRK
jgi:hypothetical protein